MTYIIYDSLMLKFKKKNKACLKLFNANVEKFRRIAQIIYELQIFYFHIPR